MVCLRKIYGTRLSMCCTTHWAGCWGGKSGIRSFNVAGSMKLFYWKDKSTRKSRKNSGIGGFHEKVARADGGGDHTVVVSCRCPSSAPCQK